MARCACLCTLDMVVGGRVGRPPKAKIRSKPHEFARTSEDGAHMFRPSIVSKGKLGHALCTWEDPFLFTVVDGAPSDRLAFLTHAAKASDRTAQWAGEPESVKSLNNACAG